MYGLGHKQSMGYEKELINKILEKHRSSTKGNMDDGEPTSPKSPIDLTSEIKEIKIELSRKNHQIEELNELLKAANVTINKLSDRLTTLEEKVRCPDTQSQGEHSRRMEEEEKKTLLIGDTNLLQVKATDLGRNCFVRTIKGGNCNLISSWIKEKLNWKPSNCILVCGTQDILKEETPSNILDNLGSLTTQLKEINEGMVINICQIGPTLKTDELGETIGYFNDQLEEWCKENGVILIKKFLAFKLGTGEVDHICYEKGGENSGVFINRLGAIRLLSTLEKSCKQFCLRENWNENCMLNGNNNTREVVQKTRFQKSEGHRSFMMNRDVKERRSSTNNRNSQGGRRYSNDGSSRIRKDIYHSNNEVIETIRSVFNNGKGKGCYHCGELNHRINTCRFDLRLRCGSCNELGHKRKLCQYFSN